MLSPGLAERLAAARLDPAYVERVARDTVAEDLAGGQDVTSVATVPPGAVATADLVARTPGVVAGLPVAEAVYEVVCGPAARVRHHCADGTAVAAGTVLSTVTGPTRGLLTAERSALNLLGHLSGIATLTRAWVDAVAGTGATVRDTRKTTPGLRLLEKYAVRCGGGENHRLSLADAALVKDNHILAAGGIVEAFQAVRERFPGLVVEVEADTVGQALAAVEAGADLVLLDNFGLDDLREAVRRVAGRARLEASGGLVLADAARVAATGVDYLAVGALTHSAHRLDVACDVREGR